MTTITIVYLYVWVIAVMVGILLIHDIIGVPPKHCQYMVKVTNKSGVYSCSQYPRPITVKK